MLYIGGMIADLDQRTRDIFRQLVDLYLETGSPVGSRVLAEHLDKSGVASLSPASVRHVMSLLEQAGLLYSPHTSAGRLPTERGLRFFVDGLLELGRVSPQDRVAIEESCHASGKTFQDALSQATGMLSGLSSCAGLVLAQTLDRPLRHIEFVPLEAGRALVVLVTEEGQVENRIIDIPLGIPSSSLVMASNFLAARLQGKTLDGVRAEILTELQDRQHDIDELTQKVIAAGLGVWSDSGATGRGHLIVRGQSHLVGHIDDVERLRHLFSALETVETMERLLSATSEAEGVKVFVGAESGLFGYAGCSMVVAPLSQGEGKVLGAVGVIGPTRLNYARIVPLVDYTARALSQILARTRD